MSRLPIAIDILVSGSDSGAFIVIEAKRLQHAPIKFQIHISIRSISSEILIL